MNKHTNIIDPRVRSCTLWYIYKKRHVCHLASHWAFHHHRGKVIKIWGCWCYMIYKVDCVYARSQKVQRVSPSMYIILPYAHSIVLMLCYKIFVLINIMTSECCCCYMLPKMCVCTVHTHTAFLMILSAVRTWAYKRRLFTTAHIPHTYTFWNVQHHDLFNAHKHKYFV